VCVYCSEGMDAPIVRAIEMLRSVNAQGAGKMGFNVSLYTHTHTHIYIYIYIYVFFFSLFVCTCVIMCVA